MTCIAPRSSTRPHVFVACSLSLPSPGASCWASTCTRDRKAIHDNMLLLLLRALLVTLVLSLGISCAASSATTAPHTWGPQSFLEKTNNNNDSGDSRARRSRNDGRIADSSSCSGSSRQQSMRLLLPGGALRARGGGIRAAFKEKRKKWEQKGVNQRALPPPEALSRYI